jgi:hypothetical protein
MSDRYLVLKGMAGFGDRLMTLGRAFVLAQVTGRKLLVDWTDVAWNHAWPEPRGFWHYFDLQGPVRDLLGATSDAALIETLTALNSEASVLPAVFRGSLVRSGVEFNHARGRMELHGVPVRLSEGEIIAAKERVVVYMAYNAGRLEDVLPYLVIRERPGAVARPVIGVHFRNTDKANNLGDTLRRVQAVWKPGRSIYLATDDAGAIDAFRSAFGSDLICGAPPPPRPASGGGIHHALPDELAAVELCKEDLTWSMLQDITTLRSAVVFVDCPNSLFSKVVWMLRAKKAGSK